MLIGTGYILYEAHKWIIHINEEMSNSKFKTTLISWEADVTYSVVLLFRSVLTVLESDDSLSYVLSICVCTGKFLRNL
jgi:hypothetical protein